MSKVFFSGTDAELLAGAANFSTLITAAPGPLGLSAGQATFYATLNASYATSYAAATNPGTRTKAAIATKDTARANLVANSRQLANIIYSTVGVTNTQRVLLGLKENIKPSPVPQPSSAPLVDFISTVSRTVKIRIHDGTTPKKSKPAGVKSASVYSFVGLTAPANVDAWKYEGNANKSVFDITFPDSVANGALIWVAAIWKNAKNQSGPPSDPISINIPGGGLSMAA